MISSANAHCLTIPDLPRQNFDQASDTALLWETVTNWVDRNLGLVITICQSQLKAGLTTRDDLIQEACLIGYATLQDCCEAGRLDAFVNHFTRAIREFNRQTWKRDMVFAPSRRHEFDLIEPTLRAPEMTAEDRLVRRSPIRKPKGLINRRLSALTQKQREFCQTVLNECAAMNLVEIARHVQRNPSNISRMFTRTIEKLEESHAA